MKVGSKDADTVSASFALLFVKNYAILDLSDKISTGGWWIPKCCLFAPLKSDNAHVHMTYIHTYIIHILHVHTIRFIHSSFMYVLFTTCYLLSILLKSLLSLYLSTHADLWCAHALYISPYLPYPEDVFYLFCSHRFAVFFFFGLPEVRTRSVNLSNPFLVLNKKHNTIHSNTNEMV